MKPRLLLLAAAALLLGAAPAHAKGGPPKDGDHPSHSDKADKGGKPDDKAAEKAEKDAEKAAEGAAKDAAKDEKAAAKDAEKAAKTQTKAEAAAARLAAKEAKFKRSVARAGYTCRGGTTHLVGTVVAVVLPTATTPGSVTITVTKGNKAGRSLVGQQLTIGVLAGTDVIREGKTTIAALLPGTIVNIDARTCTAEDTNPADTITPSAELLARKLFARR